MDSMPFDVTPEMVFDALIEVDTMGRRYKESGDLNHRTVNAVI